jgi:hypothetical protein
MSITRPTASPVTYLASNVRLCRCVLSNRAVLIFRQTGNLRAVELLLGPTKVESTVGNLGIEIDDAIEIAVKVDI